MFLVTAAEVDPVTGRFLKNPDGSVRVKASGILVGWDEVEYLEFIRL